MSYWKLSILSWKILSHKWRGDSGEGNKESNKINVLPLSKYLNIRRVNKNFGSEFFCKECIKVGYVFIKNTSLGEWENTFLI